jgi:hypothetical protein
MTDYLKAGGMGDPNLAGKPGDFANSMAEAIENTLLAILVSEGKLAFEANDNSRAARDRRMLFVAVAQGVVNYLATHQAALEIWNGGMQTGETITVRVDPTPSEPI